MTRITLAAAALLALALPATAAPIQVTDARIAAGRMIIVGKSTPGTQVAIVGTNYKATVNSKGYFRFAPAWRPASCRVTLKSGVTQVGAVIALCGPQGVQGPAGPAGAPVFTATTTMYSEELANVPGTPAGQFPELILLDGDAPGALTVTRSLAAGQKVFVSFSGSFRYSTSAMFVPQLGYNVCMIQVAGPTILPTSNISNYLSSAIGTAASDYTPISVSGVVAAPQAGNYTLGLCVRNSYTGAIDPQVGQLTTIDLN